MSIEEITKALGDETRRAIIELLADGEKPASYLFNQFSYAAPTVSRHLSVLKEAGLVTTRRDGVFIYYQLEKETLKVLADWLKDFLPKEKPKANPKPSAPRPPKETTNIQVNYNQFGSDL